MKKTQIISLNNRLQEYEEKLLDWALSQAAGNITKAANLLSIGLSTLQMKMVKFGMRKEDYRKY